MEIRRFKMFDFNKLDSYRSFMLENSVVGLCFHTDTDIIELTINEECADWDLYIRSIECSDEKRAIFSHKSYEDFKTKVADYFLGGEE